MTSSHLLPPFSFVFAQHAWRLEGIEGYHDIGALGRGNADRLLSLARDRATAAMHQGGLDRAERRDLERALGHLGELASGARDDRPILPRLRVEHFGKGDPVALFLGDTPGAPCPPSWHEARVVSVDKAFNPAWATGEPNSGYYWQLTASADHDLLPGERALRYSTSEPRALLASELVTLRRELAEASRYAHIFCRNACRPWAPVWCLERRLEVSPSRVDVASWFALA